MPVFEYECDSCIDEYNSDISTLVKKLNKTSVTKMKKKTSSVHCAKKVIKFVGFIQHSKQFLMTKIKGHRVRVMSLHTILIIRKKRMRKSRVPGLDTII